MIARPESQEIAFEVQGRLVRRRGAVIVRDESRTTRATSLPEAIGKADALVADGFTTWIYRLDPGTGINPVYRLVRSNRPHPVTQSATKPSTTRSTAIA